MFQNLVLPVLKIYSARDVNYRFSGTGSKFWNTVVIQIELFKH